MSHYLYLQCVSHEPYLRSEDAVANRLSDLPRLRTDIQNREDLVARFAHDLSPFTSPYIRETIRFLADHPNCDLEICDAHGVKYPIVDPKKIQTTASTPIGMVKSIIFTDEGLTVTFESLTPEGRDALNLKGL